MVQISKAKLLPYILILFLAGCGFKANTGNTTSTEDNSENQFFFPEEPPDSQQPTSPPNSNPVTNNGTRPGGNTNGGTPMPTPSPQTPTPQPPVAQVPTTPPVVQNPQPTPGGNTTNPNFVEPSTSNALAFWDQFEDPALSEAARVPCGASSAELGEAALILVNYLRTQGLSCSNKMFGSSPKNPYQWDETLYLAARNHGLDMDKNNFFGHSGADGSNHAMRAKSAGWTGGTTAENIAGGRKHVGLAVVAMINSKAHCDMLVVSSFNKMGAACQEYSNFRLSNAWIMLFGRQ